MLPFFERLKGHLGVASLANVSVPVPRKNEAAQHPGIHISRLLLAALVLAVGLFPETSSARMVAGFEVPYTFNPIRTGPGWNDSDVWEVTLTSDQDDVGICNAHRQEQGSNTLVLIGIGYARGQIGIALLVRITGSVDATLQSNVPAKLDLFKDGIVLMSLDGLFSWDGNAESWSAVLTGSQLQSLLQTAVNGRVSGSFITADQKFSATVANLITSPNRLYGEFYPTNYGIYDASDLKDCLKRAKIIGHAP